MFFYIEILFPVNYQLKMDKKHLGLKFILKQQSPELTSSVPLYGVDPFPPAMEIPRPVPGFLSIRRAIFSSFTGICSKTPGGVVS
jgi:hypothetical protein